MSDIKPPRNPDSVIGQCWSAFNKLTKNGKENIPRDAALLALPDVSQGTVSTQLQRYRTYHGLASLRGANSEAAKGKTGPAKKSGGRPKKAAKKAAKKKAARKK